MGSFSLQYGTVLFFLPEEPTSNYRTLKFILFKILLKVTNNMIRRAFTKTTERFS